MMRGLDRRSAMQLLGSAALLPALPALGQANETERLNAFFEEVFQRNVARSPIRQARLGIRTNQDKWDDISEAHHAETAALVRGDLEKLRGFALDRLTPQAQISYRLFEWLGEEQLTRFAWRRNEYLVTQMGGMHRRVATVLLNDHPIKERKDAEAYIARLRGVKKLLAQLVTELERQEAAGVKPPRFVFALTIGECTNLITGAPFDRSGKDSPLYADFKAKVAKANLPDAARLVQQAEAALREGVGPGYRTLIAHLRTAEASATDEDGVWKLPQGAEFYRAMLRSYTTLPVGPEELHQIGLREVARIHDEIRAIMRAVDFSGTLQQFFEKVRNDPALYYSNDEQGKAAYLRDAEARLAEIRERAGEVLGLQPKADVVVRAVEPWREKAAPKAFYASPPEDGSVPGIFYVNLFDMRAAPKYVLPVQLYHEAIPGHHVETVVAQEIAGLPKFRKFASIAAYSEGWGLYSERLPKEMGLYRTPYEDLGRLSLELMRAGRLVVDTGMHALRWTRAQAVAWFDENLPSTHYDNQREIDRYVVLPGQAVSYEVGMLKIVELRARAQAALGGRFDLRGFHDLLLAGGPMPLPMLEQAVDSWIAERRT
jgi:uncharacterized protein (DUF885 family)